MFIDLKKINTDNYFVKLQFSNKKIDEINTKVVL